MHEFYQVVNDFHLISLLHRVLLRKTKLSRPSFHSSDHQNTLLFVFLALESPCHLIDFLFRVADNKKTLFVIN